MSEKNKSLRSDLGRARGLGAAKSGVHHWAAERLSALILIPVSVYFLLGFIHNVVDGGYSGAVYWLQSVFAAAFTLLFLLVGLKHLAGGLQVVIDDYVHAEGSKLTLVFIVKLACALMAVIGSLALARVYLGV
jgi:succinate dehydrogenase / fumarate reductase membrane anchor subunit